MTSCPRHALTEHMDQLHVVAEALLERETLTGEEFKALMEGRELPPPKAEQPKPADQSVGTAESAEMAEQAEKAESAQPADAGETQQAPADDQ